MTILLQGIDLGSRLLARIAFNPEEVRAAGDFADLSVRAAIEKTLPCLTAGGEPRRREP